MWFSVQFERTWTDPSSPLSLNGSHFPETHLAVLQLFPSQPLNLVAFFFFFFLNPLQLNTVCTAWCHVLLSPWTYWCQCLLSCVSAPLIFPSLSARTFDVKTTAKACDNLLWGFLSPKQAKAWNQGYGMREKEERKTIRMVNMHWTNVGVMD